MLLTWEGIRTLAQVRYHFLFGTLVRFNSAIKFVPLARLLCFRQGAPSPPVFQGRGQAPPFPCGCHGPFAHGLLHLHAGGQIPQMGVRLGFHQWWCMMAMWGAAAPNRAAQGSAARAWLPSTRFLVCGLSVSAGRGVHPTCRPEARSAAVGLDQAGDTGGPSLPPWRLYRLGWWNTNLAPCFGHCQKNLRASADIGFGSSFPPK